MPRIDPLAPPYEPEVAEQLQVMMPTGAPPILLFRTFVKNLAMAAAMGPWGGYELSKRLSLSMRDREILIDRTCARCGCEYEWGVHVAFFAERVGLSGDQVTSLTHGSSSDECWSELRDRVLIDAADALHDSAKIDEGLFGQLAGVLSEAELLDLCCAAGTTRSATRRTASGSTSSRAPPGLQTSVDRLSTRRGHGDASRDGRVDVPVTWNVVPGARLDAAHRRAWVTAVESVHEGPLAPLPRDARCGLRRRFVRRGRCGDVRVTRRVSGGQASRSLALECEGLPLGGHVLFRIEV